MTSSPFPPYPAETLAPDLTAIEELARAALLTLPEFCREAAALVLLRVVDFPDEKMMADLEIEDPFELTGLYEGTPLTEKSVMDQPQGPDVIWLFRRALLDEWIDRGDVSLGELVAHVLVHELAHHFGWSDAEIAEVDRWWE